MTYLKGKSTVWRYVIATDRGGAPHIHNEVCSLAICKPDIRKHAKVGEWVMAFAPASQRDPNRLVKFVMKITSRRDFPSYCKEFIGKRRDAIYDYRFDPTGPWVCNGQIDGVGDHPYPENWAKDKRGLYVLLSKEYCHSGNRPRNLLSELAPFCAKRGLNAEDVVTDLDHRSQGQSKYCSSSSYEVFREWAESLPKGGSAPPNHDPYSPGQVATATSGQTSFPPSIDSDFLTGTIKMPASRSRRC